MKQSDTCRTCQHFDKAHPREPADDCCRILYDKNGFWCVVKPDDYCSWHTKIKAEDDHLRRV